MLPIVDVGTTRKELVVSLQDHSGHAKADFAIDYIAVRPVLVTGDSEFKDEYEQLIGSQSRPNLSILEEES